MSNTTKFDKVSFPGGYIFDDITLGVALAATAHLRTPDLSDIEQILVRRCFDELRVRHPERFPFQNLDDLYQLRAEELFEERLSLLNSHFRASWFCLSYWSYGLFAVRSGISKAEFDDPDMFVTAVQRTLGELGIRVSEEECLAEIDRFIPAEITERNVLAGAYLFLSFVRFLHNGALRRREVVTPRLILVSAYLGFVESDAHEANNISSFLATHGVSIGRQPAELTPASRLVVLCSREAMASDIFWRGLGEWRARQVIPVVVCLMPKAEFYREPPADWRREIWTWLSENVAVQLGSKNDRYVMLLRALDPTDEKKWWWNEADAVELGLSVDLLGLGLPRPATFSGESNSTPHIQQDFPRGRGQAIPKTCRARPM